ncbi:hypothetical protein PM082_014907 [Marasmius tenuissimus]|nr:hypothetical protein PM082_014907 [Marasmius tenuissimus]
MSLSLPLNSYKWRRHNSTMHPSGLLYSQMAEFDLVSNQARYKDKLSVFLEAREKE